MLSLLGECIGKHMPFTKTGAFVELDCSLFSMDPIGDSFFMKEIGFRKNIYTLGNFRKYFIG
jgi:hypothetical protein